MNDLTPLTEAALITPLARLLAINGAIEVRLERINECAKEIALLIKEVHDDELWRETHTGFGAWFVAVFKKHRSRAYQLLNLAGVSTLVDNESQARELADLEPDMAALVMEEVGPDRSAPKIRIARRRVVAREECRRESVNAKVWARREASRQRKAAKKALDKVDRILTTALKLVAKHRAVLVDREPGDGIEEGLSFALERARRCGVAKVVRVAKAA